MLPTLLLDAAIQDLDLRGFQALLVGSRKELLDGRRDDVRAVWDELPIGSHVFVGVGWTCQLSEGDWVRLEQYLEDGGVD